MSDRLTALVRFLEQPMTPAERDLLGRLERDTFPEVVVTPTARRYLAVFDGWPADMSERRERARAITYRRLRRRQISVRSDRLALARSEARRSAARLSPRERQVLTLHAEGLSRVQIAERLGISPETVKTRMAGVASKIGTSNHWLLARYAVRAGLVDR